MEIKIDQNLVFANQFMTSKEEALSFMCKQLYVNGYVKEGYTESLLSREIEYPTGLNTSSPKVAIPHTDYNLVNESTICVMTLDKELTFSSMEDSNQEILIAIIIMMALDNPDGQLEMLQIIMELVQNTELKTRMINCKNNNELCDVVSKFINNKLKGR